MSLKEWYAGKKAAISNWLQEKKNQKKRAVENQQQLNPRMRVNLQGEQQPTRWQRTKTWTKAKAAAIGLGIVGMAKLLQEKIKKARTEKKQQLQVTPTPSNSSVNAVIFFSLLYYLLLDFYLPFPSLMVRFSFNFMLFIFFYYVLFDASERNGDVLRQLLTIALVGEFLFPYVIATFFQRFSFLVYLLPWWLIYAVMMRGRDSTTLSKWMYRFMVLYLIALFFVAFTILISVVQGTFDVAHPAESATNIFTATNGPLSVLYRGPESEDVQGRRAAVELFKKTGEFWLDFVVLLKNTVFNIETYTRTQIEQAGGAQYYTGEVEENKNLPLGVIIENVKPTDTEFEPTETVSVYGSLIARTLNDPVTISPFCYKGDKESKSSPTTSSTYLTGIVQPHLAFTVYDLDEEELDCSFKAEDILKDKKSGGSFKITLGAAFNFETIAYLKSYFMDNTRLRSMKRAQLDPLETFDIADKKPEAIFTPGPVKLGIGMKYPPIGVYTTAADNAADQTFRVGITVDNNLGWKGKIQSIDQVVIYLPPGVEFDLSDEAACTHPFIEYTQQLCEATIAASSNKAYRNCVEEKQTKKVTTQDTTQTAQQTCVKEVCAAEFIIETGQQVKAYTVDVNKSATQLRDIKSYKTFSCRAKVYDPTALLGTTPVSVRYVKAKVKYTYVIEQSTQVKIKAGETLPPLASPISTIPTTTISSITKTKILGYTQELPGNLEAYTIAQQIEPSQSGTKIYSFQDHRLDQQTAVDITGLFAYYDLNDDKQADMIIVTEMNTQTPTTQKYLLVDKNAKLYNFVVETFKQNIQYKATEVQGDTVVVRSS